MGRATVNGSTALRSEDLDNGAVTGRPFWLATVPEPIFTVLHTPAAQRTRVAALILPTFGWDNDCCYRVRRDWATALATAGIIAARIDFPGTENSVGSALEPNRLGSWVDATASAAQWLRQHSGCDRLVAIGIGLGGVVAYTALAADAAIDDLILWGVRASGRAYVRELRAYAAIVDGELGNTLDAERTDGVLNIGGHVMSVETAEALGSINLAQVPLPQADSRRVLLVGRDAHGVDGKLKAHIADSGAELTVLDGNDYHIMMLPPELSTTATETIPASIDWLAGSSAVDLEPIPHPSTGDAPEALDSVDFEYDGVVIRERIAEMQTSAGRLVGIVSEPTGDAVAQAPYCLVGVNSGALRHTGPNRLFVEVARRAAADGIPAARVDLPGLGDSDGSTVRAFERTFEHDAGELGVIKEIHDHLQQLGIADRFAAIGLCLGAYLPMRAMLDDDRTIALISANIPALKWSEAHRKLMLRRILASAGRAPLTPAEEGDKPPKLLGPIAERLDTVRERIDRYARRWLAHSELLWRLEHRAEIADISRALKQLGDTDASTLLLFSELESVLRILKQRRFVAKLKSFPNIRVEQLPTRDHLLRPLWVQEIFLDRVALELRELRPEEQHTRRQPATEGSLAV